jgi:5-methylcytosine-specific restriction endonuclease McrA
MPDAIKSYRPRRPRQLVTKERAHYVSAAWKAIRKAVLVRDAYTCRACGRVLAGADAQVDHVVPLEEGGTDALDNLQTLCLADHGRKTRAEQKRRGLL